MKQAGLWIDHAKAILITLEDEDVDFQIIESHAEAHLRLSGGSRGPTPFSSQDVASEKKRDRRRRQQLKRYYEVVLDRVDNVDRLVICGPGEAKTELASRIHEVPDLDTRLVGVLPQDKMTDRQLVAWVHGFFETEQPRS